MKCQVSEIFSSEGTKGENCKKMGSKKRAMQQEIEKCKFLFSLHNAQQTTDITQRHKKNVSKNCMW